MKYYGYNTPMRPSNPVTVGSTIGGRETTTHVVTASESEMNALIGAIIKEVGCSDHFLDFEKMKIAVFGCDQSKTEDVTEKIASMYPEMKISFHR